jgi:hypothetical protein
LAGSIRAVLPALIVISEITADTGGVAAALAIGAFIGQALPGSITASQEVRRRRTAQGGLSGMAVMIGIILFSKFGW